MAFKQIAVAGAGEGYSYYRLYALDDGGKVWRYDQATDKWVEVGTGKLAEEKR